MSKPLKPIPKFTSESEERAFWESRKNDSADYVDWTKAKLATFAKGTPTNSRYTNSSSKSKHSR
jgi:hypothetical protein